MYYALVVFISFFPDKSIFHPNHHLPHRISRDLQLPSFMFLFYSCSKRIYSKVNKSFTITMLNIITIPSCCRTAISIGWCWITYRIVSFYFWCIYTTFSKLLIIRTRDRTSAFVLKRISFWDVHHNSDAIQIMKVDGLVSFQH